MSLLRDLIVTVGDVLRLSNDVMQRNIVAQTKALKRGVGRVVIFATLALTVALMAATGAGFIAYGLFICIAGAIGPAASGLIVGLGLLVAAIIVFLIGRGMANRPAN